MNRSLAAAPIVATLALGACAVGPAYSPPPPPMSAMLENVTAMSAHQVPGYPACTDYSVTGTLGGSVQTVNGRACHLAGGATQIAERVGAGGPLVQNTYQPPAFADDGGFGGYGGYGYGPAYGDAYAGGFGDDPFFYDDYGYGFGYPFLFGFGGGYGFHHGFHGGGFRGHGGFHGGGGGGGFHGGSGGGGHGGGGGGGHR